MAIILGTQRWMVALIIIHRSISFSGFKNNENKTPELNLPGFILT